MRLLGATSEIRVQPRLDMPWPKKATDMTAITRASDFRKAAEMMVEDNSRPATIGSLRPKVAEPLRLTRASDS
ncbi:hypothetical protein D3C80_1754300 [compost metagenome]